MCTRTKCDYYARNTHTCDFILLAHQRRGCPAGKECTRYRHTGIINRGAFNTELAYELWKQGKTAKEIAEFLHVCDQTIYNFLHRKGLPLNPAPRRTRGTAWDRDQARKLYDGGATDEAIAAACGCSIPSVQKWRQAEKLTKRRGTA